MSWTFGNKPSYKSLVSSIGISFFIFGMALFATNDWRKLFSCVLFAVISFVLLVTIVYPIFLPRYLNYVRIDDSGIEFYQVEDWWDKVNLVFNPYMIKPVKVIYDEITEVDAVTNRRLPVPQRLNDTPADTSEIIMPKLPSGIEITTVNREKIVAETNWPETTERCKLDEALKFARKHM